MKTAVSTYWHKQLVAQAANLPSLHYLRCPFLPLGSGPHPLWWTCQTSPSAVRAATIQAKMLSGRYRSCWLRRHWTGDSGACRLPGCGKSPGDTAHLISGECSALHPYLATSRIHLQELLAPHPQLLPLVLDALEADRETTTTFILDPSTNPLVLVLCQHHGRSSVLGPLFRACRAWVWAAHRTRMRLLGLNQYIL